MMEEAQGRKRGRSKLWIAALALTIIVSIIVIPPLVSINRYKSRIAQAISNSLGRPVRLSTVELRLLPRPAFIITDLTVDEDLSYGAEPVLHAVSVTASIRLMPLWTGRLEISRISVDEASLNLVRTTAGRWNLDSFFRTAAQPQPVGTKQGRTVPLPYLEATNSRINIKQGFEKLPYSLVNADLSFWQEEPGDWRVRLKAQPARTDVSLDQGDTGIVQLEGRMQRASELRLMPVHVEMEWRSAQLGQLSRLLIGSDPGWRGDLTAEMKMDGTADAAQVTTRLRATGVHRAEFAPKQPLDFDANCGFVYHYSGHTVEKLVCDSPLGDGRLRIEGNLPSDGNPTMSLELQKIPAQAVLDALRTVRQELGTGLEADGTLSGKLSYDATVQPVSAPEPAKIAHSAKKAAAKLSPSPAGPLSGSITIDALRLSGGTLSQPIQISKIVMEPSVSADGKSEVLAGNASVPAGAPLPLVFELRLTLNGYQMNARGAGTPARVRQIAQAAGLKESGALDAIAGDPVTMDLSIEGPWLPAPDVSLAESAGLSAAAVAGESIVPANGQPIQDRLMGSVSLHNANWKTDALATAVQISQATLHLGGGASVWDPVAFAYGPLKGTAHVTVPAACATAEECLPIVSLEFPDLDAAELQSTLIGAENGGTLFSSVMAKLGSSTAHTWPAFQGTVKAGSLQLGSVTLDDVSVEIKVSKDGADIPSVDATVFGGQLHATGKVENNEKPTYSFEGQFQGVHAVELCQALTLKCTGASFGGDGRVEAVGYAGKELSSSAKGQLHFQWKKGSITGRTGISTEPIPPVLARFDLWTADATIASGAVTLKENQLQQGSRKTSAAAAVTFGEPPKVNFTPAKSPGALKK